MYTQTATIAHDVVSEKNMILTPPPLPPPTDTGNDYWHI